MKNEKIAFENTKSFSSIFLDYLNEKPELKEFYGLFPNLSNFEEQIKLKSGTKTPRALVSKVLTEQYDDLVLSGKLLKNINLLQKDETFTVTTGHQLNIFTGPVFFIYKITTVINICRQLKEKYPQFDFVPVYWMASEDHDFLEINHFHLFGKEYTWDLEAKGAVGRLPTAGLKEILDQLPEKAEIFEESYLSQKNLAAATRQIVNHLFGDEGMVVIDGDHPELKACFAEVMKDDLKHHEAYHKVAQSSEELLKMGYKVQVNPREINLFYLTDENRLRLVKKDGEYEVLQSGLVFSKAEIHELLDKRPECLSPNVVLRPLYQETLLPNLAYVGGPGEIAYWLQLKSTFDHYQVPYPILMPRNHALIINKSQSQKIQKLQINLEELFLDSYQLKALFLKKHSDENLNLTQEKEFLTDIYETILKKSKRVDGSLEGFVGSEKTKAIKMLDNVEKRLKKSEEKKQETSILQLSKLREKLFPQNSLQERKMNFLNFYLNNPGFLQDIKNHFDPFDFRFNIITEDE
ncbi:MAG: bacillithiol biosynthesis cysteine-adding enzyme BshC [Cyclobacteriaceae bacterium]